jgi:aldehyde:ferredoxin oxidoreductase
MEEPLPAGPAKGMLLDAATLEILKDAYYRIRGWDPATGFPTPAKLSELGLSEFAGALPR